MLAASKPQVLTLKHVCDTKAVTGGEKPYSRTQTLSDILGWRPSVMGYWKSGTPAPTGADATGMARTVIT